MLNLGRSAIQPAYHPVVVPHEIEGRSILVIWVPGGQTRPYKAKLALGKDSKEYAYFIRKGSSTVRAKGPDETELLSLAATVPFDDRLNQQAQGGRSVPRTDAGFPAEIGSALAPQSATLPLIELARQMHVVGGPAEAPFPLNVGLLFFHPEPYRFFPVIQIDVVWFPDGAGGNRFSEKTFQRPAAAHDPRGAGLHQTQLPERNGHQAPDRAEATRVANFPYAAVEEAVVNAVYHRGYDAREPVEIRITHGGPGCSQLPRSRTVPYGWTSSVLVVPDPPLSQPPYW